MVKMTALYHDHSHTADGGTQEIRLSEKSLVGDGSVGSRAAESAKRPRGQLRVAHQGRETTPKDPWQAKLQHRPRRLSAARAGQGGPNGAPWGPQLGGTPDSRGYRLGSSILQSCIH